MKIKVADLEPNPFRNIEKYQINREKVDALKISIEEKGFWASLPVRKHNGKYELACGHHRWFALKELGIEDIEITVEDYSDGRMIQIMAEENLDWSTSPAVTTQTIQTAKKYLDTELAKREDWNSTDKFISSLDIENQAALGAAKKGVGRDIVLKFLGGNWKRWMVQEALDFIKDFDVYLDKEAIETIPTMMQARKFKQSVKVYETPKKIQRKLAKKIRKEGIGKRDIPKLVRDNSEKPQDEGKKDIQLERIKKTIESIDSQSRSLFNSIMNLRRYMKQMEIEEVRGVKVWLAGSSAKKLLNELLRLKECCDEANS
ncbi:MAG: ParB-like nuclease domain-containing protein [Candidatus Peribacteraceae bacterium]|nr:ParB-like nuclease domain-containing protein [Candidatus Peribacteraceae bacterium]